MLNDRKAVAGEWAELYRKKGWNPLPSTPSRIPWWPGIDGYREARDRGLPKSVYETDGWPASCIQLACGWEWQLVIVDLDGPRAIQTWGIWREMFGAPETVESITPRGGRHLYFRPKEKERSRILWDGGGEHEVIEILGEKKLVMSVPSYRTIHGEVIYYRWEEGRSPHEIPVAILPDWVSSLGRKVAPPPIVTNRIRGTIRAKGRYDAKKVLEAIPRQDRVSLVKSWGLYLEDDDPRLQWLPCRAITRKDARASAGFSPASGYYKEFPSEERYSLFVLGSLLGPYASWHDCCNALGAIYLGR